MFVKNVITKPVLKYKLKFGAKKNTPKFASGYL